MRADFCVLGSVPDCSRLALQTGSDSIHEQKDMVLQTKHIGWPSTSPLPVSLVHFFWKAGHYVLYITVLNFHLDQSVILKIKVGFDHVDASLIHSIKHLWGFLVTGTTFRILF